MTLYKFDNVCTVRAESSAESHVYVLVCINTAISLYGLESGRVILCSFSVMLD